MVNQAEIHRMVWSEDVDERREAAVELFNNFTVISDRKQAYEDLHRLTCDGEDDVRLNAGFALVNIFTLIPDNGKAWKDLIRLAQDGAINVGWGAADPLGSVFPYVHDKIQAQEDLHLLIQDDENFGRWIVAIAFGGAFAYVPDKEQAWKDLHKLTQDKDNEVRIFANYSLGKVSIFKATEVENKEDLKKELEISIKFFEKANEDVFFFEPAKFCLPLYRSFYTITFKNEETDAEVQKYIAEAKIAVDGSESKKKLLEAVENLVIALKEAEKARDLDTLKSDLNAYRRYCERACELLETTEEKAPGASRLIRKGLPIIDEKIKAILAEIQEKATVLCRQTQGTAYEELGKNVYRIGKNLIVANPIELEKRMTNLQISLSAICGKSDSDVVEACQLLKMVNDEPFLENRIQLMDEVLNKILPHIGNVTKIDISRSKNIQITTAENTIQKISFETPDEKDIQLKHGFFDFINISAIAATLSGFGTYVISETMDIIPVTDYKHQINAAFAIIMFLIVLSVARKYFKK